MIKNIITLPDDDGNEKDYRIIVSFDTVETGNEYIVYTDDILDDEGFIKVKAGIYNNEDGIQHLFPVKDEEEWKLIGDILSKIEKERQL